MDEQVTISEFDLPGTSVKGVEKTYVIPEQRMTQVVGYRCSDGTEFTCLDKAVDYQEDIDWYNKNAAMGYSYPGGLNESLYPKFRRRLRRLAETPDYKNKIVPIYQMGRWTIHGFTYDYSDKCYYNHMP